MRGWKDGFVTVDGRRMHYIEAGEGPPMLLLHSGGASAYEYEHVIMPLAARYRVIAWDMAGHGDSDPLLSHHAIEDHAAILLGFADAIGLDRFILGGASIGGYIAMHVAIVSPERLERLLLIEAPLRSGEWYAQNWSMFEAMCAIPETSFEALAPRFRALTPELHLRWNIDRNKAGSWTIVDLAWAARDFDAAAAYAAGTVAPTILVGANGPTVGERDRLMALRPDARIEVLADCGHFPMIDDPDGFVRALS